MDKNTKRYVDKGIEFTEERIRAGEKCMLNYRGILAASGADRIYAHYGYDDGWGEKEYSEMTFHDGTYKAEIRLKMPGILNICFKDSADNWDNNFYENYSFQVQAKKAARKSKKTIL